MAERWGLCKEGNMITIKLLERRYRQILVTGIITTLVLAAVWTLYTPGYYKQIVSDEDKLPEAFVTKNTLRIYGKDNLETAAAISQITYPATFDDDKPNAVILVRQDKKEDGILAARVIHHPINAPILFTEKDTIPEVTWKEMERLDPQGVFSDRNIKVVLIGDIGSQVKEKIKDKGWKFRHIEGKNPFELGKNISDYLGVLHGDHKNSVVIAPIEAPEYGFPQMSWNAHMGDGFLFVTKDKVPKETAEALEDRFPYAYIYILGDDKVISNKVEQQLANYGHVQRIPGSKDIYNQSVGFAGYKDVGKKFGWWINKRNREFGWGVAEAGHNFIFVNPRDWHGAVSASVLSHKGKHGPMLLIEEESIPEGVVKYLETVKPTYITPQQMLVNHGWVIGSTESISKEVQVEIDRLLGYGRSEGR